MQRRTDMKLLDRPLVRRRWGVLPAISLATLVFASGAVAADAGAAREVERYEVSARGGKAGAARATVSAPDHVVRSVVTDFARYERFITKFKSAKIVGKVGDKTDVYLQVPVAHGAIKLWAVVRFDPPKKQGNDEVITGKLIKGNLKRLDATWRVQRVDSTNTELRLELLIVPDMPLPDSLVLGEARYAAAKAVEGTRNEAERRVAK